MKRFVSDPLAVYLTAAAENEAEAKKSLPEWMAVFDELDAIWRLELFEGTTDFAPVASSLCMQSFFSWLAAVRVALSGHASATYPLLRTSLEAACYARLISQDNALSEVWLNRDKDLASRAACRGAFTGAVKEVSKGFQDEPSFATAINEMYEATIDFGAHPNPRGILDHMALGDTADGHAYVTNTAINGIRSLNAMRSILAAAEHGYFAIVVCANSLGTPARTATLQQRLDSVVQRIQDLATGYSEGRSPAHIP